MSQQYIIDESGDRKYYVVTPQLVWALSRDPYDYTLWGVVKMIAGEEGPEKRTGGLATIPAGGPAVPSPDRDGGDVVEAAGVLLVDNPVHPGPRLLVDGLEHARGVEAHAIVCVEGEEAGVQRPCEAQGLVAVAGAEEAVHLQVPGLQGLS